MLEKYGLVIGPESTFKSNESGYINTMPFPFPNSHSLLTPR